MKSEFAFLFDVDGVIVESPHEISWREAALNWGLIDENFDFKSFYQRNIAGIPGLKGAEAILEKTGYYSRNRIESEIKREQKSVEFRALKQKYVNQNIDSGNFRAFPDILNIIRYAKEDQVPLAVVSSSESSEKILKKLGAYELFDSATLGAIKHRVNAKHNLYSFAFGQLCGKLDLDILNVLPMPIVFEDADKAIEEVKLLGYFCVGIARQGLTTPELLRQKGANIAYNEQDLLKGYSGILQDIKSLV